MGDRFHQKSGADGIDLEEINPNPYTTGHVFRNSILTPPVCWEVANKAKSVKDSPVPIALSQFN